MSASKKPTDPGYDHETAIRYIINSKRKRQVVMCVARGMAVPEIAAALGIGQATVKTHLDHMRLAFGGIRRRDIPAAWFLLTGENTYPDDDELKGRA